MGCAIATLLHFALAGEAGCVDALTTPRGHIVTAALALPVWFVAGLGLRRLAMKEWRRPAESKLLRCFLYPVLLLAPVGGLLTILGAAASLVSDAGLATRTFGFGLWLVWAAVLSAERLRVWPFAKLQEPPG